ncbi:unnamed protein product [Didymodactylos carnosus]|uniref:C2H2-type domain-containing protein n=1 Tax=Didymodactylos carnosus TaxID=1234261 RepID=A0A8S2M6I7_9BILA|nr:unnamed protein product [Didymodactylos carnosus]CAF3938236.1 unnamed protein product [Didymodactylos carnosus]
MVLRKASGIGDGLFIPYFNPSVKPNMKLIEPFEPAPTTISRRLNDNKQRSKPRKDRQYSTHYFCPVDNCTKVLQSENELLEHIAAGLHELESSTDKTSDDIARFQLFQKLQHTNLSTLTSTQPQVTTITTDQPLLPKHMLYFEDEGHCLRPKRQNKAIDPDIKLFLRSMFDEGEKFGDKVTSDEAVTRMRNARKEDGSKRFTTKQYITGKQVQNQFAQINSNRKKTKSTVILQHQWITRYQQQPNRR